MATHATVTNYEESKDVTIQVHPETRIRIFCMLTASRPLAEELIKLMSSNTQIKTVTINQSLNRESLNIIKS